MRKKCQISVDTLILLAVLVMAALVMLLIVYPQVKESLEKQSEKGACEWSLVMHSIAKLGDWSLIPAECRAHRIEITMNDLKRYEKEAKKRIDLYHKNLDKYGDVADVFKNPDKDIYWMEWSLNKIVATEMKDCWEKVFKGKLPLFDKWWTLYSWGPHKSPDSGPVAAKLWLIGKIHQAPVNCIICSRIRFSDDVKQEFIKNNRGSIDSLNVWMKYNYPMTGGRSYYEILTEGQSELNGIFAPNYVFSVYSPLAVLYEKIYYYHGADVSITGIWDTITPYENDNGEVNYLKLVPYTQERLVGPLENADGSYSGNEGCTFILD